MRLLLIRHGETDHNAQQLVLGREDVALNERGQRQAQALADALSEPARGAIAALYSSPLQRAVATATPLATALSIAVQIEAGLIEMDIGVMEGQTFAEVRERHPDFFRGWLSDGLADVPMPGGETLRQVQERAGASIDAIRDQHQDATVAVVSHNFVILTLLCRALGLPLAHFRRLRHDVAAVSVLELTPERQAVLALNDRCHLQAEGLGDAPPRPRG